MAIFLSVFRSFCFVLFFALGHAISVGWFGSCFDFLLFSVCLFIAFLVLYCSALFSLFDVMWHAAGYCCCLHCFPFDTIVMWILTKYHLRLFFFLRFVLRYFIFVFCRYLIRCFFLAKYKVLHLFWLDDYLYSAIVFFSILALVELALDMCDIKNGISRSFWKNWRTQKWAKKQSN